MPDFKTVNGIARTGATAAFLKDADGNILVVRNLRPRSRRCITGASRGHRLRCSGGTNDDSENRMVDVNMWSRTTT